MAEGKVRKRKWWQKHLGDPDFAYDEEGMTKVARIVGEAILQRANSCVQRIANSYFEGMTIEGIAKSRSVSKQAISARLRRAGLSTQMLRAVLYYRRREGNEQCLRKPGYPYPYRLNDAYVSIPNIVADALNDCDNYSEQLRHWGEDVPDASLGWWEEHVRAFEVFYGVAIYHDGLWKFLTKAQGWRPGMSIERCLSHELLDELADQTIDTK
jgi:hypothetical protein